MTVEHTIPAGEIVQAVALAGYTALPERERKGIMDHVRQAWWCNPRTVATIASGAFLTGAILLDWWGVNEKIIISLYGLAMLSGGYHAAKSGYYAVRSMIPDMNFLMTIAAVGAAAIGQWSEGATVVFLFSFGNALQTYTMNKTRESIRSLMDFAPRDALVRRKGKESRLPVEDIVVGDSIIVKPGERIAMDGEVTGGTSTVNQAPITGESMPVEKDPAMLCMPGRLMNMAC